MSRLNTFHIAVYTVFIFLAAPSAGAGIQALESSATTRAGTYLGTSGWQYQQDTIQAVGASSLQAEANTGLSIPGASTTVNSTANLTFTDSGHGSLSYIWTNRADVPGGPGNPGSGGSVTATFAPASLYNSGPTASIATYAFLVGGDGALSLTWNLYIAEPKYSSTINDLLFRHFTIPLATLDRFHDGQLAGTQSAGSPSARSAGSTSILFSAMAGDMLVLRLLPSYIASQDGGRVNSLLEGNQYLQFSVSAVPEPETYAMMLVGLGLLGFAARRTVRQTS